ncbi:hypothetical protein HNY73_016576 [Argiope bruennichi]|uniref:Uncharacterized protein n=1 Tax=Argiope bruennichi TaxID=94029 RepID=A0A8T0EKC4_ARGBR|nr:hypothetical protein HNY73_016576 [Argiope bruennichi]
MKVGEAGKEERGAADDGPINQGPGIFLRMMPPLASIHLWDLPKICPSLPLEHPPIPSHLDSPEDWFHRWHLQKLDECLH